MPMRAATAVQQLCKSCRTCFKFYCMFYFTCDRFFTLVSFQGHVKIFASLAYCRPTAYRTRPKQHPESSNFHHISQNFNERQNYFMPKLLLHGSPVGLPNLANKRGGAIRPTISKFSALTLNFDLDLTKVKCLIFVMLNICDKFLEIWTCLFEKSQQA